MVFVIDDLTGAHQGLVVLPRQHMLGAGHAFRQDVRVADRAHELRQAQRELIIEFRRLGLVQIHHHDGEIDAARGRDRLLRLHDVLFAQDAGLVLQDQHAAPVAVLDDGAVQNEFLAGLER
ncbi:hypothetical protein D3C80_1755090 [compost metagenome]